MKETRGTNAFPVETTGKEWATRVLPGSLSVDNVKFEVKDEDSDNQTVQSQVNGHVCPVETNGPLILNNVLSDNTLFQNGNETSTLSSSCNAALSSQIRSSTCISPVLAKHPTTCAPPGNYQSPYQAGINQRFHAARHKFQGSLESEPQTQAVQPAAPISPKDLLSPVSNNSSSSETNPVKQMARSTVTQVLSRFTTVQQSAATKLTTPNNSPFGTDYRSLAAPLSPVIGRATGAVLQGIRSPTFNRGDRGNPPPIPPKKPGLAQAPLSPGSVPKSATHFSDSPLSGSCGLSSAQEGVKELDMVVSSN